MLTTYLTEDEDEGADELRKARAAKQSSLEVMKAALKPSERLVIGGDPGCDVVPFRKAEPPPQRPRPPVQQPLRPAAITTANDVFHLFKTDRPAFDRYLARTRLKKLGR